MIPRRACGLLAATGRMPNVNSSVVMGYLRIYFGCGELGAAMQAPSR